MLTLKTISKYLGLSHQIAMEGTWSLGLRVASTALGFLSTILLARLLGASGYGIYAFSYAVVVLLALPAQAGLPNLVLRETARAISENKPGNIRAIWSWSAILAFLISLGIIIVAGLIIYHKGITNTQQITLLIALPLVPLLAFVSLVGSALRGLKHVVAGQIPESIIRPTLFLLLLVTCTWLFRLKLSPSLAITLRVIAGICALITGAFLLQRYTPPSVKRIPLNRASIEPRWGKSAVIFALIAAFGVISNQASTVILGLYVHPSEIGIFRVAAQLASLAAFGLQAVNMVVAPRFAGIYARGDLDHLQYVVRRTSQIVLGFSLCATLFFVFAGRPILEVLFGPEFVSGYVPLVILLVGQLVNSAAGSVGLLLNMTGYEAKTALGLAIASVSNIAVNLILVPLWGASGAATATAVSLAIWNVALWNAARKNLRINTLAFSVEMSRCVSRIRLL